MSGPLDLDLQSEPPQSEPISAGRRGAPRLRLSLPARVQTMYDTRRCVLIDLSRTGAQLGLEKCLRNGESAILELPLPGFRDIDQFGTVVRSGESGSSRGGGVLGLQFDTPLTDQDVLAVRRFSESFEEEAKRSLRAEVRAWVSGMN